MESQAVAVVPPRAPRRTVGGRVARACRELAERCATYPEARRWAPFPEPSRLKIASRIGRPLRPTEERIYGVVRKAVRVGRAGVWVSLAQWCHLTGRCLRSVTAALATLEAAELIERIPVFEAAEWEWNGRRYERRQLGSVCILGERATWPGRVHKRDGIGSLAWSSKSCYPNYSPPKGEEMCGGPAATPRHPSSRRVSEASAAHPPAVKVSPAGTAERPPAGSAGSVQAAPDSATEAPARPVAPAEPLAQEEGPGETRPAGEPPESSYDPKPGRSSFELKRAMENALRAWDEVCGGKGGAR